MHLSLNSYPILIIAIRKVYFEYKKVEQTEWIEMMCRFLMEVRRMKLFMDSSRIVSG